MNVWLVTIGEPVPVGFGAQDRLLRTAAFAFFLADNGHRVTWWTSTFDHFRKGHLFDKDTSVDFRGNLKINLIHGCGYAGNISFRRILDHRLVARKFSARIHSEEHKPDIIVASLPTINLCFESVKYGQEFKIPIVLDMRDMWPDILVDTFPRGMRTLARWALSSDFRRARQACEGATAITGITDAFLGWGLEKAGRGKRAIDKSFPLGYNSDSPSADDLQRAEKYWDGRGVSAGSGKFHICFFGTLGRQLDVATIIRAARKVGAEGLPIDFIMCGSGNRLEHYRRGTRKDANIIFPGRVDAACIHALMRRSAIGLDPMPDRYDFRATINNKAIEYLSAGLPVLSSPDQGVLADLLKENGCGMSYPCGDADALTQLIVTLHADEALLTKMSRNATKTFEDKFCAEKVYGGMMNHLEEVAAVYHQGPA